MNASDKVIQVEKLGKRYSISHKKKEKYLSIRDTIADGIKSVGTKLRNPTKRLSKQHEDFWALKDISFDVERGDRIGIIGRNGAGKSTLLKILSQITEPTAGRITLRGRVASLLEVGTGFHPELTGRENIYLNGAILGMSKAEIRRKFDEIVAFAEVENFLDTPVKRYSSGMYVRLAFAVAAHLETEILVVDEVLAVGDAQFQKKCLGKMGEVSAAKERTVLFVSHNMAAVQSLCDRIIWLNHGELIKDGSPADVIPQYLKNSSAASNERIWCNPETAPGNHQVRLHRVCVVSVQDSDLIDEINVSTPIKVEFEYWNFLPEAELNFSFVLYNFQDICIFNTASRPEKTPSGLISGKCYIPGNLLNDGGYRVRLLIVKDASFPLIDQDNLLDFEVADIQRESGWYGKWVGAVRPQLEWEVKILENHIHSL